MHPVRDSIDLERRWRAFLREPSDIVKLMLLYSEVHEHSHADPRDFNWHGLDPAGVDEIGHLPGFRPAHDSLVRYAGDLTRYEIQVEDARRAARQNVAVVTTVGEVIELLATFDATGLSSAARTHILDLFRRNLQRLKVAGVRVLIGSDRYRENSVSETLALRTLGVFSDRELLPMGSIVTCMKQGIVLP